MLSKFRKLLRVLPNVFMVLGAVIIAVAMMLSLVKIPVAANNGNPNNPGQEVCPGSGEAEDGGVWQKVEDLDGFSFTFDAGEGNAIIKTCYKAGSDQPQSGGSLEYNNVNPPSQTATVSVGSPPELSHAAFLVIYNYFNGGDDDDDDNGDDDDDDTGDDDDDDTGDDDDDDTGDDDDDDTGDDDDDDTGDDDDDDTGDDDDDTGDDDDDDTGDDDDDDTGDDDDDTGDDDDDDTGDDDDAQDPGDDDDDDTGDDDDNDTGDDDDAQDPGDDDDDDTGDDDDDDTGDDDDDYTGDDDDDDTGDDDDAQDPGDDDDDNGDDDDNQSELDPPTPTGTQTVLIPVTGIEFGNPLNKTSSVLFNTGLGLLGIGLVLQSIRRKIR